MTAQPNGVHPWVLNAVILVVTIAWAANVLAEMLIGGFEMPRSVHAAFLGVISLMGAWRAAQAIRRNGESK